LNRQVGLQKAACFAIPDRNAGLATEVVFGVARHVHAVLPAISTGVGSLGSAAAHRKAPGERPEFCGIFPDRGSRGQVSSRRIPPGMPSLKSTQERPAKTATNFVFAGQASYDPIVIFSKPWPRRLGVACSPQSRGPAEVLVRAEQSARHGT
jgi:hypothetical protein